MAVGSIKFKIDVDTKQLGSSMKQAQSSLKETASAAKSSSGVFSSIGNGLKSIGGAALTAVGRVGKMAAAVTVFKAVNSAVGLVTGSITGAISRIDTLNNSQRVFENMGFSAQESSAMMKDLQKSIQGLPTGLDSAVQGVQLLAASTNDIGKSQELFSALNNGILGFGGSTEMVQNALVQLSQAFSNGKVDAETWNSMIDSGLGPALNALAKEFGMTTGELKKGLSDGSVSVEDFQNALIKLNKEGGGGLKSLSQIAKDSTAGIGTGLQNMQTAVTRGVAEVIKSFDSLLTDLTGMGISEWIAEIGSKFETGLQDIAKNLGSFAEPIKGSFGTIETVFNAFKGLAETTSQAVMDAMGPIGDQIGQSLEMAANFITDNMDTIESIVTTVVEVVTGVILGLGDTVQIIIPYFDSAVKIIGDVVDALKDMLPEGTSLTDVVREWTPKIVAAIVGFKLLKGGLKVATGAFKTFNGVLDGVGKFKTFTSAVKGGARAFEKLSPAGKVAAKMFGKVGSAVKTLASVFGTAFKAMGAAVIAHPIIAAIVAIVAIVILLWNKCEWFREGVIAIWEAIKEAWAAGCEAVGQFMSDLGTWISETWTSITAWVSEAVTSIWTTITETWNSIVEAVAGFMLGLLDAIVTGISNVQTWWTETWTAIGTFFSELWTGIVTFFVTTWEQIKQNFAEALAFVADAVSNIWNGIKAVTEAVWNGIKAFIANVWTGLKIIFTTAVNIIKTIVQTAWNVIKAVTSAIWNGIKVAISIIWNGIKTTITTAINIVKKVISTAWNVIKTVTSTVWNGIKAVINTVWTAIKNFVTNYVNNMKRVITNAWNTIKSVTSSVWNGIKSAISNAINGAKSIVSNVVGGIKSTVSNVFNGVKSTVTTIWNGIKTAITRPIEAAKNTIRGIVDTIKRLFNFKLSFPSISIPHIPLPHFEISGSFNPLKGELPHIGINWYATGGIFNGPSVVGIGEAGTEAVVPLSNKSKMAPFAKAVADFMKDEQDSGGSRDNRPLQKVILQVPLIVNGKEIARATVDDMETELNRKTSNRNRRGGKK